MASFTKHELVHAIESIDDITATADKIRNVLMKGLEMLEDEQDSKQHR
jgi:hypothetical protein